MLVGSNFRVCRSASMWSGMAPTCRGKNSCPSVNEDMFVLNRKKSSENGGFQLFCLPIQRLTVVS